MPVPEGMEDRTGQTNGADKVRPDRICESKAYVRIRPEDVQPEGAVVTGGPTGPEYEVNMGGPGDAAPRQKKVGGQAMMKKATISIAMLAGVLALSSCARNKEDLPPPPPQAEQPAAVDRAGTVPPAEEVGTSVVPGSQEALIRAAGSDTVLFAFDSYLLDDEARQILGAQANWLAENATVRVTVEGHTDERGTREYNLALGERRANAARNFLAAQGVAGNRLSVISYGKERPAADGSNEAAWAQNRRAVTIVTGAR